MQDDWQILRLVTQRKASRGRWPFLCQRIAVRIMVTKWEIYPNLVTHMEIPYMHSVSARLLLPQPMYYQQSNKSPYLFQGSLVFAVTKSWSRLSGWTTTQITRVCTYWKFPHQHPGLHTTLAGAEMAELTSFSDPLHWVKVQSKVLTN